MTVPHRMRSLNYSTEAGKMKEMRKQILMYMETNSRVDLGELAVILGTDEADVANEIARMEKEGIICGYHTLIDWDKTGEERVNAVYLISGGYDLLVTLEGKTLQEVARFVSGRLSPIEDVISTTTHFIMKKYKEHGTLMRTKNKTERMPVTP